jgi:translation initiation factor IF-1
VAHAAQLRAPGTVIEVLRDDAYRVELPNGHRCIAKAPKVAVFASGEEVVLEFHPYDLSRVRIVVGI